uniref:Aldo/keto reductase n=1 Tax=Caulobacter sp. (strain K31) TaxID=366602 RepID=B0T916_CAUSK
MTVPSVRSGAIDIPAIGFSTFKTAVYEKQGLKVRPLLDTALEAGYRHFDTAQVYGTEQDVGAAIAASGLRRDEVFISTKVWVDNLGDGDLQRSVEASLQKLQVDQVDLLLVHWPRPSPPLSQTLKALNDAHARGMTKALGFCNYPSALMRQAAAQLDSPLATNQVEFHPYLAQEALRETAADLGASLTAWSPLAQGWIVKDPWLANIGKQHGKTPAQVALRFLIQQGAVVIPRTKTPARIAENLNIFDFRLLDEEMAILRDRATQRQRIGDWIDRSFQWDVR